MKKLLSIFLLLQFMVVAFSQQITFSNEVKNSTVENIKQLNLKLFYLTTATDTIHFIKYDTVDIKKPLFLFIQGSLPMPLIIENNDNLDANHFRIFSKTVFSQFNVIEISQPNTPPIVNIKHLNNQYSYVKSEKPYDFDKTYERRNIIETYTERANTVIDYLIRQDWIDKDSIFAYGHSQGAYIAARLASENEYIKVVGFSGTNPFGRYAGVMQELRAKAIRGQITEDEAQKEIERQWNNWKFFCYINRYSGKLDWRFACNVEKFFSIGCRYSGKSQTAFICGLRNA